MTAIWDEAFLKQLARDAREEALAAQSDDDWDSAVLDLEQGMSNVAGGFRDCPLPACRRARQCVGNKPLCMPRCAIELVPGGEQECVEEFYAAIQQERRDAAVEQRAPDVERVMEHRVHVEQDEDVEDAPLAPANEQAVRDIQPVREAPRIEAAPPKPAPPPPKLEPPPPSPTSQPPLRQPEPAPAVWEPKISPETEERVNRIWAEYVANPAARFRPEPRIRSLSDERPSGVPPWWKGER